MGMEMEMVRGKMRWKMCAKSKVGMRLFFGCRRGNVAGG